MKPESHWAQPNVAGWDGRQKRVLLGVQRHQLETPRGFPLGCSWRWTRIPFSHWTICNGRFRAKPGIPPLLPAPATSRARLHLYSPLLRKRERQGGGGWGVMSGGEGGRKRRKEGDKMQSKELNSGNILLPLYKGVTTEETGKKGEQNKVKKQTAKRAYFSLNPKINNLLPKIRKKLKSPEVTERKLCVRRLSLSLCPGQPTFLYIRVFFHLTPSFSHITARYAILYLNIAGLRPIPFLNRNSQPN